MTKINVILMIETFDGETLEFTYENFRESDVSSVAFYDTCYNAVGEAVLFEDSSDNSIYLEFININEECRRRGYGLSSLNALKDFFTEWGYTTIHGECKGSLIPFYAKVGGVAENRCKEDSTYFNHRFYIDLN